MKACFALLVLTVLVGCSERLPSEPPPGVETEATLVFTRTDSITVKVVVPSGGLEGGLNEAVSLEDISILGWGSDKQGWDEASEVQSNFNPSSDKTILTGIRPNAEGKVRGNFFIFTTKFIYFNPPKWQTSPAGGVKENEQQPGWYIFELDIKDIPEE